MEELLGGGWEEKRQEKIGKWARVTEFDSPKNIIITSFRYLCGTDTNAKPEFRDEKGCVYRLIFKDMDNGGMERMFEIKYSNFRKDMEAQRVQAGVEYKVTRKHEKVWKWYFEKNENM